MTQQITKYSFVCHDKGRTKNKDLSCLFNIVSGWIAVNLVKMSLREADYTHVTYEVRFYSSSDPVSIAPISSLWSKSRLKLDKLKWREIRYAPSNFIKMINVLIYLHALRALYYSINLFKLAIASCTFCYTRRIFITEYNIDSADHTSFGQ